MGAQNLKYDNFIYLEKIAEESNVKFYLEFGGHVPAIIEGLIDISKDIHYIDINHTFGPNEGICVDNRLSLSLLRDLNFVTNLVKANIKKISANGWGFCEPGAGMLNTKLDFDNGASANLLLVNSAKPRQIQAVVYCKSGITRIFVVDNIYKITKESHSHEQIEEVEKLTSSNNLLKDELKLFLAAIQQKSFGLRCIDDKSKAFRVNHLVHEKVNHFASNNIFYS